MSLDIPTKPTANSSPNTALDITSYGAIGLRHAAIIMDGNRRWARERDLPTIAGHQAGVGTLKHLIEHVGPRRLEVLTVYAFSTENWRRAEDELVGLMGLFGEALVNELQPLHQQNVRVRFLGDARTFPPNLQQAMADMDSLTANNTGLTLQVAMNYGGRAELVRAIQRVTDNGQAITEASITQALDTASQPEPDLLIRTGGEQRLSNFLLWQAAYAELAFTDTLWPDFTPGCFDALADTFAQRQRRFGK